MPKPTKAMVFAAGMGKRMRPLTDHAPKPMISIKGKPMLGYALDALAQSGIHEAVVNTHYKAEAVEQYLHERTAKKLLPHTRISFEEVLLETGGGILHAKALLGKDPIYTINSDIIWKDGKTPALDRLADMWDAEKMDALLLLQPLDKAIGYEGPGNFNLTENHQLSKKEGDVLPYVYTGIQIINPSLFYTMKKEPFSLNVLYKKALQPDGTLDRIYGVVHDGEWFHVGTPDAVKETETLL